MTPLEIESLYILQSENVRHLASVLKSLKQEINRLIDRSADHQIQISTKILALVYSAWSEAQFLQILYTPRGLSPQDIGLIKTEKSKKGIAAGWKLMLRKAIDRVGDPLNDVILHERLGKLDSIVEDFIEAPSTIRNKIAHGQWVNALNGKNTAKNEILSSLLLNLDPVLVLRQIQVHQHFGLIVRDLMQSPLNGFHRHYVNNIGQLEQYIIKTQNWNLESKREKRKASTKKVVLIHQLPREGWPL